MHMADPLLSPAVGITMCAVSIGAIAYASAKIKKDELSEKKLPVMAVAGAFVFAAQMINFTIPATGSSGHIGGGILLAALLGSYPAMLTISAVLIVQCLFFADGGLLALGCNIFNMGIIPCLVVYPLIFKALTGKGFSVRNLSAASILSVVIALQLGSFGVVLQTLASDITALPFGAFFAVMQPIHLAIGIVEGIVTGAVLCFVHRARPEILTSAKERTGITPTVPIGKTVIILCVITLTLSGGLSLFASAHPDGLEWSMEQVAGTAELKSEGAIFDGAASVQDTTAFMPDYDYSANGEESPPGGVAVAGIIGSIITFALAGFSGLIISRRRKHRDSV